MRAAGISGRALLAAALTEARRIGKAIARIPEFMHGPIAGFKAWRDVRQGINLIKIKRKREGRKLRSVRDLLSNYLIHSILA